MPPPDITAEEQRRETPVTPESIFTGIEIFPRAGEVIEAASAEAHQYWNTPGRRRYVGNLNPFLTKHSYELADWFIKHKVGKGAINDFFKRKLGREDTSFSSTYGLRQKVCQLYEELGENSWEFRTVEFQPGVKTEFWYRDPMLVIQYLLRQRLYAKDMAYAPYKDYNESGERVYGELHTADWWWETQ
ncbi:MAG: hypothetical protein L6R37_008402, partial [Teloschistes peruensis]